MKTSTAHSHRAVNVKHGGVLVPGVGVPHQLWANFAPLLWKYHSYRMWAEIITDFLIITFPLHMDGKWSVLFKHPKHWGPPGTSLEPQNQWSFDIITNHYWKQLSWWRWWCLVTNQHIYVCVTCSWTFLPRYKPEEKLRISSKVGVDPQEPAVALYIPQNTHHCATRWWFFFGWETLLTFGFVHNSIQVIVCKCFQQVGQHLFLHWTRPNRLVQYLPMLVIRRHCGNHSGRICNKSKSNSPKRLKQPKDWLKYLTQQRVRCDRAWHWVGVWVNNWHL